MKLGIIDWLIIASYFLLTLGIGLAFAKRAGRSVSDFFLSGRSLPWWIAGTSMVATTFAADTPLAVTGLIAKYGLAGNWLWWSLALGGMFTVFVYAKLWRRSGVVTELELIELRYSGRSASALRGIRAGYLALIVNPLIIGWVTKAMIDFLHYTVFFDPASKQVVSNVAGDWGIIFGLFAVVGIYVSVSGMWGVAVTDVIQFVIAMIGCIWLAIIAVGHVGGTDALVQKVNETFSSNGGSSAFDFLPSLAGGSWLPLSTFLIMVGVQWWITWYPGAEPGGGSYIVQRIASCKDERHAIKATLWYQIAHYCIRPWPWIMVAFVAIALFPEIRDLENPGVGFPMVIREIAPMGLRGLLLVTFFAAFMSTISTQMNWGASILVRDIYQRFMNPQARPGDLARASRWASVLVLLVGVSAAYLMIQADLSIDRAWSFLLALGAGGGLVYMLRWFWWRINAWSEIAGMLGSLFFFIYFTSQSFSEYDIDNQELILVVAIPTIVLWILVTYLTPPDSEKKLVRFYRLIRPGGPGWRPIARLTPDVSPDQHLGLSIIAAFLGSGMVFGLLYAVGRIIFGDYSSAALAIAIAILCGVVVFAIVNRISDQDD